MKRADLTPGMEVLVSSRRDWQDYPGSCDRWRILDAGRWVGPARWDRSPRPVVIDGVTWQTFARRADVSDTAPGVLAVLLDRPTGNVPELPLVAQLPLAQIKGPWEPTFTEARERRARIDARYREDAERARSAQKDAMTMVAAFDRILGDTPGIVTVEGDRIAMDRTAARALLARLGGAS